MRCIKSSVGRARPSVVTPGEMYPSAAASLYVLAAPTMPSACLFLISSSASSAASNTAAGTLAAKSPPSAASAPPPAAGCAFLVTGQERFISWLLPVPASNNDHVC